MITSTLLAFGITAFLIVFAVVLYKVLSEAK